MLTEDELKYSGFWIRAWAALIDTVLMLVIITPILLSIYGIDYYLYEEGAWLAGPADFLVTYVFPALATILFWVRCQATPGKMAIRAKIVDAETGGKPTTMQFIGRYFAYTLSLLIFGLGFLWIAFDKKKQGWHDKLAGTVVIQPKKARTAEVRFKT